MKEDHRECVLPLEGGKGKEMRKTGGLNIR